MVGKINDTLQILLGRHCIFDIKQILYDYRNGPKCSASFRAITMYLSDTVLIIGWLQHFLAVQIFSIFTVYMTGDFKLVQ